MAGHATDVGGVNDAGSKNSADWDYIIVGAGSAGCVLASRLTQDGHFRVLLVEGGGEDYSPYIRVPAGLAKIDEKYNWRYTADPDPSRNGLVEHWGAGKVIGGSSSINGQVWTRGNAADYDEWAKLGADGWDGASVLPYFKRAERFEGGADQYRGDRGRQSVEYVRVHSRLTDAFVEAAQQAGYPYNADYNGDHQLGVGYMQLSQRRGWRASAARAYLAPARRRPNLRLAKQALATRIIIEGDRAVGVEYRQGGTTHTARARREVLLCAGALASPKLLMLSGVGPEDELRPHRIDVRVASPGVGLNLQEHIWATVMCTVNIPSLNMETTPRAVARHGLNFVVRGRGAVATPAAHAILFGQFAHDEEPGGDRPDYEMAFAPFGMSGDVVNSIDAPAGAAGAEYRHDVNEMKLMSVATISLMPSVSHPRQRGTVGLRSADPDDGPRIVHQLLGNPDDVRTLIAACRRARDIAASDALRPYVTGELMPGPAVQSDEEWTEYFRTYAYRGEHPSGTCRMGTDKLAVVDPQLKVHGLGGLRVVDASVMPTVTTGHTNAPVIMIAERVADLIRSDANAR
jgi:choline dehydrogenase